MSEIQIPSKTVILAANYRAAMDLAHDRGRKPRECIIAADSSRLEGLILREGDTVLVADVIASRTWEALLCRLVAAGCAIAGSGRIVKIR